MSRAGEIRLRARDRALKRDLDRAERQVGRFGNRVKTTLGSSFKGGLATVGSFAAVGGLSNQVKEGMQYQTTLQRMGDQAKMSKGQIADLDKEIRGHATSWGLTNSEMLDAAAQLVNLQGAGPLESAKTIAFIGEAMTATGASAQNTSRVMSALMDQGVKTPQAMRAAFDALIEAGDQGNIPFDLMANNLSSILPMLDGLVSAGKQGHAEVGGLLQVLGKVTGGDISQAQTLTKALTNNLRQKKKALKDAGFGDLFDKDDNLRALYEIRGRLEELSGHGSFIDLITSSEARTAIKAIGDYGDEWERIAKLSAESEATQRKAEKFMQSSAGKWRKALADIKNKFHAAMTPERIEAVASAASLLVDVLIHAGDHLGTFLGMWAAWKGLGLARYLGEVSGSMQQLGGASATAGKALGAMSKVGLVGARAGATMAIGSYVDQVAGFSAKVGDLSQRFLDKKEQQATSTRDWLRGVESGDIAVDDGTRKLVHKRMSGEKLTQAEKDQLFSASWGQYNEDDGSWQDQLGRLGKVDKGFVERHNKRVDDENAQVERKTRGLIQSGEAVRTLQEMAVRERSETITGDMLGRFMRERGLDAQRHEFVRTGKADVDEGLSKLHAGNERRSDEELERILVEALQQANIPVTVHVSMDPNRAIEDLANAQTPARSY